MNGMNEVTTDPRSYGLGVIMGWPDESIELWLQACEELDNPSSPAPTTDDLTDAEFAELVGLDQLPSSPAPQLPNAESPRRVRAQGEK